MKNMKRSVALLVAIALLIGCAAGGTMAWLTMKTAPVVNTFTAGDINITLDEGPSLDLKMVPGKEITKDPKVTVKAGSEPCYVFVKVEETNNPKTFLDYSVNSSNWTVGLGGDGKVPTNVYWSLVTDTTTDKTLSVLTGDIVTVKSALTKSQLNAIGGNTPTLTFTAYAVQQSGFADADAAWTEAVKLDSTP